MEDTGRRERSASPMRSRSRSPMDSRYAGSSRDEMRRSESRGGRSFNVGVTASPSEIIGVFGLNPSTNEGDLEKVFAVYGALKSCTIVFDKRAQVSRGFGFVTFESVEDAKVAVDATKDGQLELHGRQVRVDFSKTRTAHNPTPGRYMGRDSDRHRDDDRFRGGRYDDRDRYERRDRYEDSRMRGGYERRDERSSSRYEERRSDDRYPADRGDRAYADRSYGDRDRGYDRRSPPRRYY